jgi:hypothetical protein
MERLQRQVPELTQPQRDHLLAHLDRHMTALEALFAMLK